MVIDRQLILQRGKFAMSFFNKHAELLGLNCSRASIQEQARIYFIKYQMLLFENDFVFARKSEKKACMYSEWLRSVSPEEFREGVELFVKFILEEEIELWIVNASRLHGIRMSDQQWILSSIIQDVMKSKLRKIARIGSGDIFQYMSFEELVEKAIKLTGTDIEVAQFTSLAMAEAWINIDS